MTVSRIERAKHWLRTLKPWGVFFVWGGVIAAIFVFLFVIYLRATLPDPESIVTRQVKESTRIYDRTGEVLLYDIFREERRTVVPWEQIPQSMKDATIALEDSNFFNHKGIDLRGIVRAFVRNVQNAAISQGGSTITQQLVKKALLGDQRTFSRKIRELMLAIEIERKFTKEQILWMYLNQIPYGSNAYGIESASRTFFGKPASQLTLGESALLAAIPKAPTYFSPYGSHTDELFARQDLILERMVGLGLISEEDRQAAAQERIEFKKGNARLAAPHFVIMAKEYLARKYGEDIVESSGFKIITTLDAKLQATAEDLVAKYAKINRERYKADNAALVALDPRNGDVLALVGSSDYFDIEHEGNFNVATANRQPGSAFKPFAYATAFQKGYPDSTVLLDVKTEFNPNCSPNGSQLKDRLGFECYHPRNYDGTFRGPVTMRQALGSSLNVPSVETLYLAGVEDTIDLAQRMGISTLGDRSRFGLSLVLGGAEVKLVDIVSAYGVFANDGMRNPWTFIQRIELPDGTVLEEKKEDPERVLDSQTARLVTDVLSDNAARAPIFGYNSALYFPGREVAAKTGTTQENRDGWVIGYTPSVVVGVWTGNNDNTSMTQAGAGLSAAGPLWREFISLAMGPTPESFIQPNPVTSSKPMLNGEYPSPLHSLLYYVNRKDPLGPEPGEPGQDPQFDHWEWAVQAAFPSY